MVIRFIACLLVCLVWASPAPAKTPSFLRLSLESSEIFLGDIVILEVSSTGLLDPIDFVPLGEVAAVGRQTVGTHIAVINGQVVEVRTSRIELTPRKLGSLVIGPLMAGDIASNTVKVEVLEDRPIAWTPTAKDIRLDQTVSVRAPWLQQQVVLDIAVRYRHPLSDERMQLPDLAGFRAAPIYEERRTLDETDGGWAVIAWRYLLYPERSGNLTLAGARFSATLAKSRAERATVDLSAPGATLAVKPAAFPAGRWWLPADDVRISDDWSGDPRQLSAGDEIERTITVSADGVLAEQIPDIVMSDGGGLAVTPLGEAREGKLTQNSSSATATFRFRVRALSPIPVFLDTVRLPWWNVIENRAEDAIVPARRIDIGIPDRDKLLANAETEPSLVAATRDFLAPTAAFLPVLAALSLAAVVALVGYYGLSRRGAADAAQPAKNLLAQASAAARHGDADGLYRALRRLSRLPGADARIAGLRERLESSLFNDKPLPFAAYAAELKAMSGNLLSSGVSGTSRLPGL